jgi:outer membrane murein-binding lipoprotein Lpp
MANATQFFQNFNAKINQFIADLEDLNTMQDRLVSDNTLAASAATAAQAQGRSDLATVDFTNAAASINQILFTFNSGTPTQKSYLYKII